MPKNSEWEELIQQNDRFLRLERGLSPNTLAAYSRDLIQFARSAGSKPPSAVSRRDILEHLMRLRDQGVQPSSAARKLVAIKVFFRFLLSQGLVSSDPAAVIESPRLLKGLPEVLDIEEAARLLKAIPGRDGSRSIRDRALLELLYASGLRVSEASHLKITDLNQEAGFLRCMGKGGKERVVPVGRHALQWIQKYLQEARPKLKPKEGVRELFLSRLGRPLSRVSRRRAR